MWDEGVISLNIAKESQISNLFDNIFKILFIGFWSVFLFTTTISTNNNFSLILFSIYNIPLFLYIIIYPIVMLCFKINKEKIIIYYRLSTLITFIFTAFSFVMFPTNLTLLFIKLISIAIYMYLSAIKVYKYKIEEGVVGIMSSLLILVMLFCFS